MADFTQWQGGTGHGVPALTGSNGVSVANGTSSPLVSLTDSGVIAGSYTSSSLTIDAYGRVIAASNGAGGGASTSDFVKIASGSVTNAASLDFTNLSSTYHAYYFVFNNALPSAAAHFGLNFSQNNGTSFDATGYTYCGFTMSSGNAGNYSALNTTTFYIAQGVPASTVIPSAGEVYIINPTLAGVRTRAFMESTHLTASDLLQYYTSVGETAQVAHNAMRFAMIGQNIMSLNYVLYGIKA